MKLKTLSLVIIAILAISVTGVVVTDDSAEGRDPSLLTNQSGFFLYTPDYTLLLK
jgi:hypothetical protein